MAALFVVVLSIAAGAATYVVTIRNGRRIPAAVGFDAPSGTAAAAVGLGSRPAVDLPSAPEADEPEEADAEIVDLDAARTPEPTEGTATTTTSTDEADEDG